MPLTVKEIEAARYGVTADRICDGNGLYLRVLKGGGKVFQLRHVSGGKRVWVTLGTYPDLGLKAARDLLGTVRGLLDEGIAHGDVLGRLRETKRPAQLVEVAKTAPRRKQKTAAADPTMTFRDFAKTWFDKKVPGLKNGKHIAQNWSTIATYAMPTLGDRPVGSITRMEIIDAIDPIWRKKNETAKRTLGRLREIFELAVALQLRQDNPAIFNPLVVISRVKSNKGNFGSLPWNRIRDFWTWLQTAGCEEETRQATMLAVLSAKRTGEIRFAAWAHLDETGDIPIWTTPAALMKKGRAHRVPISRQMGIVFENMRRLNGAQDRIFWKRGTRSGVFSENTMLQLVKQFDKTITVHGMRATFKTWAADHDCDRTAVEFALAHSLPPLEAAYMRSDLLEKRVLLMQDWADFVTNGMDPVLIGER